MTDSTEATTTLEKLGKVIGRASYDSSFRSELIKSAVSTLTSSGVNIPSGSQVTVESNTATARYLVLPANPVTVTAAEEQELSSQAAKNDIPSSSSIEAEVMVVIKALNDDALRSQLLSDPKSVLEKAGAPIPSGITIKVLEATSTLDYLVLAPLVVITEAEKEDAATEAEADGLTNLAKIITAGSSAAGLAFAVGATRTPMKIKAEKVAKTSIETPAALIITAAALLFLPTTMPSKL